MGMNFVEKLNQIHTEIEYQPSWRGEADRCHQYFDGKQLEPSLVEALKRKKMPVLITNLIAPAINGILGMEARTRTDWFVRADDDEFVDVAEGLNIRVGEGLRMAKANRACSEAYQGQVIGGLSWVEVKKNKDPLGSKYQINNIHRDEIFYDWGANSDFSNAKWLVRQRWVDLDEVQAAFPSHKDVIKYSVGQWSDMDTQAINMGGDLLQKSYDEYQHTNQEVTSWLEPVRNMVKVYELYYRVWDSGIVLRDSRGNATVYNEENPMHVALIASGKVEVERRLIPSMRLSWYVGPHHILDMKSPHPHNHFPYVPFFGIREDKTKIPYGLVRNMLSPQDEINFRRIKLTSQLNHKRIVMSDGATKMSDDELIDEVHAVDGIVKLDAVAMNKQGAVFKVETDTGIAQQQFNIMQEAKTLIQDVAGIYNAFLGKEGGAQSGIAINSLVEQGATTLADINDNYRDARQKVGELILAHEVEEIKGKKNVQVFVPKNHGAPSKTIVLNEQQENGEVTNAISQAKTQVVLGEINQSAGYRAQMTQILMDFISKLPTEIQVASLDIVIEQMDIPEDKRERLLKVVQKATGNINPEDMSDEEKQAMSQRQQLQSMLEQLDLSKAQLSLKELETKIQKLAEDTNLVAAKTESEHVKAEQGRHELSEGARLPPRN